MRLIFICLLSVLSVLIASTGLVQAEEVKDPDSSTEQAAQMQLPEENKSLQTIGVGTEGYGSPIRSDTIMTGEVVSPKSGNFHPFISLGGYYTDNLFNTEDDEKSDYVAVISPGMWVAAPGTRQKLIDINTMNMAPGGLALSRFRNKSERRIQGYALYRADIRRYDKYTDDNRTDHRGEGYFGVNLRGGLSFEVLDVLEIKADPYGTGGTSSRKLDKFTSNLVSTSLAYELTPKVTLRGDYGHYYLNYNSNRNEYRNRNDDTVSAYLFYQYSPKTAFFIQGQYINIDYKEDIKSDSDAMNYFIGMQMDTTAKTRARIKVGYSDKNYDDDAYSDNNTWLAEAQGDYFFTPKTSVYLRAMRKLLEADTVNSKDIVEYSAQLGYRQRFTAKVRGEASVFYSNDDYSGDITVGDKTDERDDDYLGLVMALGFTPIRWLNLSTGYEYRYRNSNFDTYDYKTNMIFLRMTAAL